MDCYPNSSLVVDLGNDPSLVRDMHVDCSLLVRLCDMHVDWCLVIEFGRSVIREFERWNPGTREFKLKSHEVYVMYCIPIHALRHRAGSPDEVCSMINPQPVQTTYEYKFLDCTYLNNSLVYQWALFHELNWKACELNSEQGMQWESHSKNSKRLAYMLHMKDALEGCKGEGAPIHHIHINLADISQ